MFSLQQSGQIAQRQSLLVVTCVNPLHSGMRLCSSLCAIPCLMKPCSFPHFLNHLSLLLPLALVMLPPYRSSLFFPYNHQTHSPTASSPVAPSPSLLERILHHLPHLTLIIENSYTCVCLSACLSVCLCLCLFVCMYFLI